ncbi:hypothetical protein CBM2608_A250002 [Cupriavidus taiwanensis]|nr:hypothetical protein CBM2608_A250002 [Cupriavidus taiwanensis]
MHQSRSSLSGPCFPSPLSGRGLGRGVV